MAQAEAPFTPPDQPLGLNDVVEDFELAAMDGQVYRISERMKDVLVIDFWSAECPISQQYDAYFNGFVKSYGPKGVAFLAVDSNWYEDENDILEAVKERDIAFPILRDRGNVIADYFHAQTTPHVFVFDNAGRLRYRGAVDDRTFKNKVTTVNYLEEAVDALLLGREVVTAETEPYGCTIVRAWEEG
ncbi:MAG: redoxin domain-containing protein [Chloroflexota bacterium]|nr:redoxin domain-containing protein [Chloroflexota bacterium]